MKYWTNYREAIDFLPLSLPYRQDVVLIQNNNSLIGLSWVCHRLWPSNSVIEVSTTFLCGLWQNFLKGLLTTDTIFSRPMRKSYWAHELWAFIRAIGLLIADLSGYVAAYGTFNWILHVQLREDLPCLPVVAAEKRVKFVDLDYDRIVDTSSDLKSMESVVVTEPMSSRPVIHCICVDTICCSTAWTIIRSHSHLICLCTLRKINSYNHV